MAVNKIELVQIEGIGLPDGIATLDGLGKVPASQLPPGGGANGIFDASNDGGTVPTGFDVALTDTLNFDSNTFVIDGTNDKVGIGTATPIEKLHLQGRMAIGTITNTNFFTASIRTGASDGLILLNGADATVNTNRRIAMLNLGVNGASTLYYNPTTGAQDIIITNESGQATIFNQNNEDVDFRIDGVGVDNIFRVDAANDRIGIGTALPSAKLHVNSGNIRVDSDLALVGTPMLRLLNSTSNAGLQVHADGNVYTNAPQFSGFATQVGGTNVWQVTTNSATSAKIRLPSAVFTWNRAGDDFFMFGHDGSSNSWAFQDAAGTFTTPDASSLLSLNSSTKGFLPPRMTTTERNAISSPAEGLVIYNETTQVLNFYNGTTWGAV